MSEEIGLPKATILNLVKGYLSEDTRISTEANEVILSMSKEFVNHLSSVSNDICLEGGKKTISQAHVAEAMKNLKLDSYLMKIMKIEDTKELEGMTKKERKLKLNSSLNVSRKKRHRLTKEQEEELRRKQASLFQNDHDDAMLASIPQPTETHNQKPPPTFPSAGIPSPQPPALQPNDPKFYDGSITQILQNPLPTAGIPLPNSSFPMIGVPQQPVQQNAPMPTPQIMKTAGLDHTQCQPAPEQPPVPPLITKGAQ